MPVPTEPRTLEDLEREDHKSTSDRMAEEKREQERLRRDEWKAESGDGDLDEALEDTFPASDPAVQP